LGWPGRSPCPVPSVPCTRPCGPPTHPAAHGIVQYGVGLGRKPNVLV
jgi:hypothetical protein